MGKRNAAAGIGLVLALGALVFAARSAFAADSSGSPGDSSGVGPPAPQPEPAPFDFFSTTPLEPGAAPSSPSDYRPYTMPGDTVPTPTPDFNAQLQALLAVIRQFESANDYTKLYGGGHFADYSTHPNVRVPFYNPLRPGPRGQPNDYSTAAGAYQENYPTFLELAAATGLSDFSPATQDAHAIELLKKTGAYNALANGDVPGAFTRASARWASLPGSTAMQGAKSMDSTLTAFNNFGGTALSA